MYQNALPLLRFAGQRELLQEQPQRLIQFEFVEIEVFQIFIGNSSTEVVAKNYKQNTSNHRINLG